MILIADGELYSNLQSNSGKDSIYTRSEDILERVKTGKSSSRPDLGLVLEVLHALKYNFCLNYFQREKKRADIPAIASTSGAKKCSGGQCGRSRQADN